MKGDRFRIGQEGDSRYMAAELLDSDPKPTTAADIFSLGMVLFEAATCIQPPPSGALWRDLRDGKAHQYLALTEASSRDLAHARVSQDFGTCAMESLDLNANTSLSTQMQVMIIRALHPDPLQRPSAQFLSQFFAPGLASPRASPEPKFCGVSVVNDD